MIHLEEAQIRYLLSLFLTFTFSCALSVYQADILHVLGSLAILLVAYSLFDVTYYVAMSLFTLTLHSTFKKHRYARYILMFSNLCTLTLYKTTIKNTTIDISGALMLLVIKSYYLGKEYNDSMKMEKILSYLFLMPGIMMGPVMSLKQYTETKRVYHTHTGLRRIAHSFLYLVTHVLLVEKYTYKDLPRVENFAARIAMLVMICVINKCKYYFAWTFTYGCFSIIGIENMKNVYPLRCEFSDSIRETQNGWNIFTNKWLKDSIFIPLKRYGYMKASIATFTVSALWHGLNPCYFLMFITFAISVPLLKNNTALLSKYLGVRSTQIINIVTMTLFISFFSVPFFTLDVEEMIEVWRSVYFYGIVFLGISLVGYIIAKQKLEHK